VRPPSYTTCSGGLDGEHLKTREELDQEPVSEKDGCGQLEAPEKQGKDEGGNARPGKTHEIGAQYPCNSPTRPDGWHPRAGVEKDVQNSCSQSAEKIDQQEFSVAKPILDAAPEDEQKEHVAQDMWPAPVKKHGNHDGNKGAFRGQALYTAGRCVTRWNDAVIEDQPIEMTPKRKFEFERPQVEENKEEGGNPERLPANIVVDWNREHAGSILARTGWEKTGFIICGLSQADEKVDLGRFP
jgi:hypothetical protein